MITEQCKHWPWKLPPSFHTRHVNRSKLRLITDVSDYIFYILHTVHCHRTKVPQNESSTFVPGSEKAGERKGQGTNWPGSEKARKRKFQGADWPGSEKARYPHAVSLKVPPAVPPANLVLVLVLVLVG